MNENCNVERDGGNFGNSEKEPIWASIASQQMADCWPTVSRQYLLGTILHYYRNFIGMDIFSCGILIVRGRGHDTEVEFCF